MEANASEIWFNELKQMMTGNQQDNWMLRDKVTGGQEVEVGPDSRRV